MTLESSVDELKLSVRAANCLGNLDIETIGQLVAWHPQTLLRARNFGRKSLAEIKEVLERNGIEWYYVENPLGTFEWTTGDVYKLLAPDVEDRFQLSLKRVEHVVKAHNDAISYARRIIDDLKRKLADEFCRMGKEQ